MKKLLKKSLMPMVICLSLMLCNDVFAGSVGKGVSGTASSGGNANCFNFCKDISGTFYDKYQGVRIQIIKVEKKNAKYTFIPYSKAVDLYYGTKAELTGIGDSYYTRFGEGETGTVGKNVIKYNQPGVNFVTKISDGNENALIKWNEDLFTKTSACVSNVVDYFGLTLSEAGSVCRTTYYKNENLYYFIDAEPLLASKFMSGTSYEYAKYCANSSKLNGDQCYEVFNGQVNSIMGYLPRIAAISKKDSDNYQFLAKKGFTVANIANAATYGTSFTYVPYNKIKSDLWGIGGFVFSCEGNSCNTKKSCKTWNEQDGLDCTDSNYQLKSPLDGTTLIKSSQFQSKCCVPKTTCGDFKNGTNGAKKMSCDTGMYIDDSSKNSKPATEENFLSTCCKVSECRYERVTDFKYNVDGKDCCLYFKQDNYAKLTGIGKTVAQFKDDYPVCFTGKSPTYEQNNPSCEVNSNSFYIRPKSTSLSDVDVWIKLSKSPIKRKTIRSITNNTNYSTDAMCYLACLDKLEITLPAQPTGTLQIGQHFVWPNNNNNNFALRKLAVKKTKICRAMTNKVLDTTGKDACQTYAENNWIRRLTQTSTTTINLVYNNTPYNETSALVSDNGVSSISNTSYTVNGRTAKQYTISSTVNYSLDNNLFRYSPKNKSLLAKSSISTDDAGKYVDVGYGNLPIAWSWLRNEDKTVVLKIRYSGVQSISNSGTFTYTCNFNVDDFGQPDSPNKCPAYTQKPNQEVTKYSDCLKVKKYEYCVAKYCYTEQPYCPSDCFNGSCTTSLKTTAFRNCIRSIHNVSPGVEPYETCVRSACLISSAAVYRTISLKNPFPGKNGTGRTAGLNWRTSSDLITRVITNKTNIYEKEPMYVITLTPKNISNIRSYNKEQLKKYGYADFNLTCSGTTGKECKSDFIRSSFSTLFKSGTCGLSQTWNACDAR